MTPTATKPVPFFPYPALFTSEADVLLDLFRDVGRRGAFIQQQDLARFEENLAAYTGARHALGVANATDGLHIALRAVFSEDPLGPGDEVIFPSHTMVATAAAIHFAGATPVPVDCGEDHLIDAASVEAAITPRTRAILPVQLNGRVARMESLAALAQRHGLAIVEDAAQALGALYQGRCAGTFGQAGIYSFFPAKVLGCLGDGGGVVTNDPAIHARLIELHDHGRQANGVHAGEIVSWGLNSRLDNLQAAILDHRLRTYDQAIARRRTIASIYTERLGSIKQLTLPPAPDADPDRFDIYQNYEIEATSRDGLRAFLSARSIGTLLPWGGRAVHQWPKLRPKLSLGAHLPRTEKLFERVLLLPMNVYLQDDDVHTVCDAIHAFYGDFSRA